MSPLEHQDLLTPGGWCPRGLLAALQGVGRPSSRSWPPTGTAPRPRPRACLWRPHVPTQTVPDAQRGLRRPHPGMIGPTLGRVCALCLSPREEVHHTAAFPREAGAGAQGSRSCGTVPDRLLRDHLPTLARGPRPQGAAGDPPARPVVCQIHCLGLRLLARQTLVEQRLRLKPDG